MTSETTNASVRPTATAADNPGPVAVVCGAGTIGPAVAESIARSRDVFVLALRGWADPEKMKRFRHDWIGIGQLGQLFRIARREGCRDVILIGSVLRPRLSDVRFDWETFKLLPRIVRMFRGGDNRLLSGIADIVEENGFRLVAPQDVAPEILVPAGPLGRHEPNERDLGDITLALQLLRALGQFDVGQGAVVAYRNVLAIEAADGTDEMLAHIAALRASGRISTARGVGVLVKAPKPGQDRRLDMPSIGPRTIESIARAGLAGIAVVGGETIIAEPARVAAEADAAGVFVVGLPRETAV